MNKFSVADIMLPDHLLLRAVEPGDPTLVNWPAYKFGVETLLRVHGLEEHLSDALLDPRRAQVSSEQWKAEEELCKAIIGFNVKDFAEIFEESRLSEKSAGDIWGWLSRMDRAQPGMEAPRSRWLAWMS